METEWNRSRNSIGVTVILPSLVVAGAFPSPDPDVAVASGDQCACGKVVRSDVIRRGARGGRAKRRNDESTDARSAGHVRLAHCTIVLSGAGLRREREGKGGTGRFRGALRRRPTGGWRRLSTKNHAALPHCIAATIVESDGRCDCAIFSRISEALGSR